MSKDQVSILDRRDLSLDVPQVLQVVNTNLGYSLNDVKVILSAIGKGYDNEVANHVRIYEGLNRLPKFREREILELLATRETVDNIDWSSIFREKEFMIFVNFAGLYNKNLHPKSSRLLFPFLRGFEDDALSFEHHLIIGRYSQTPFGVHLDDATDRVIHVCLAGRSKQLLLWKTQAVKAQMAERRSVDFESIRLPDPEVFEVKPGDGFVLPYDYYHVGRSKEDVSIAFIVAVTRKSINTYLNDAQYELRLYLKDRIRSRRQKIPFLPDGALKALRTSLETLDADDALSMRYMLDRSIKRLLSRGSFTDLPTNSNFNIPLSGYYIPHSLFRPRLSRHPKNSDVATVFSWGQHLDLRGASTVAVVETLIEDGFDFDDQRKCDSDGDVKEQAVKRWLIATGGVVPHA